MNDLGVLLVIIDLRRAHPSRCAGVLHEAGAAHTD
jgi:hypothetical protein